jgi:TPR repeat protein
VKARFFNLPTFLMLALCIAAACLPSMGAGKGIDLALLAKAKAGDAEAQYQVGNAYNYGDKVRQDYAQALIWYRRGAEQGNADSQFALGGLYHFGHGVPQDDAQGFAWTLKAAKQGHSDAEFFISTSYSEGWGVAKDEEKSMVWLRKAAEQGHFNSQYMLGWAYAAGDVGVPQNYSEAYFWLDLAASEDVEQKEQNKAIKRRDEAASHLTPAELTRIQERVQQWLEKHENLSAEPAMTL